MDVDTGWINIAQVQKWLREHSYTHIHHRGWTPLEIWMPFGMDQPRMVDPGKVIPHIIMGTQYGTTAVPTGKKRPLIWRGRIKGNTDNPGIGILDYTSGYGYGWCAYKLTKEEEESYARPYERANTSEVLTQV